jgi:hypothetical protein
MATSIADDIHEAVRLDTGDLEGQIFTDTLLDRILAKAVRRLNQDLGLSDTVRPRGIPGYKSLKSQISPITYDLVNESISPDNDEIADLIILQMEYIIKKGEISNLKRLNAAYGGVYSTASNGAVNDDISVTNADGVKIQMGMGRLSNRRLLFELDFKIIDAELKEAKKKFLNRLVGNFSKLIY